LKSSAVFLSSSFFCINCAEYFPIKEQEKHSHLDVKYIPDFEKMAHPQLLDYFQFNPDAIEKGLRIIYREFEIGHGRVDLIGRDKNNKVCLIEIETSRSTKEWQKKARKYKRFIHNLFDLFYLSNIVQSKLRFLVFYIKKQKIFEEKGGSFIDTSD